MATRYITRLVNLEQSDYWIVKRIAQERGLGGKGFSAALRMIIREWFASAYESSPSTSVSPAAGEKGN
jgi:hypothetical protein